MTQESSDLLFDLLSHQFFQSVWSKVVEELSDVRLLSFIILTIQVMRLFTTNMKIYTDIDGDSNVILGWHCNNRTSESNGVLGDHDNDLLVRQVAASHSWLHDAFVHAPNLLQSIHTIRNVQFEVTAPGTSYNGHKRNSLIVLLTNHSGSLLRISNVYLDQVSYWF